MNIVIRLVAGMGAVAVFTVIVIVYNVVMSWG